MTNKNRRGKLFGCGFNIISLTFTSKKKTKNSPLHLMKQIQSNFSQKKKTNRIKLQFR